MAHKPSNPGVANPPFLRGQIPGGGRPLGFGRQLPPQLTVGRRPVGGGGGGGHGRGGSGRGDWGGGPGGAIWGVGVLGPAESPPPPPWTNRSVPATARPRPPTTFPTTGNRPSNHLMNPASSLTPPSSASPAGGAGGAPFRARGARQTHLPVSVCRPAGQPYWSCTVKGMQWAGWIGVKPHTQAFGLGRGLEGEGIPR